MSIAMGGYLPYLYLLWNVLVFFSPCLSLGCEQAALWMILSARPTVSVCVPMCVCLSVCHTFLTVFLSLYDHEIFRSNYMNKYVEGYIGFTPSVRLSVHPSVRSSVHPSRILCPLCSIYSYRWILSIFGTNDHQNEKVCHMWWPLTLTYIFKVIWLWLWKWCPLCNVFSSRSIISIFATHNHYH